MPIFRVLQGSENWHDMRRGISASNAVNLWQMKGPKAYEAWFASLQWKERPPRQTELMRLAGVPANDVVRHRVQLGDSRAMDWGRTFEAHACWVYETVTGNVTRDLGQLYALHDKHDFIGASPDALIGDWGALELKCPYSRSIPDGADEDYWVQCQVQMACMPHVNEVHLAYWKQAPLQAGDTPNGFGTADAMRIYQIRKSAPFQREFVRLAASAWRQARSGAPPDTWSSRARAVAKARIRGWLSVTTVRLGDYRRRDGGTSRPGDPCRYIFD